GEAQRHPWNRAALTPLVPHTRPSLAPKGRRREGHRSSHGFRFAPPVATGLGPFGAGRSAKMPGGPTEPSSAPSGTGAWVVGRPKIMPEAGTPRAWHAGFARTASMCSHGPG